MRTTLRGVRRSRDDGFTLIEVMVAMFITTIVMTALMYAIVSALATIQQARQRQTATALGTQQLERLRAQPYDTVTQPNGTSPCGTVAGTYAVANGTAWDFKPAARLVPGPVTESLVVNCVSGKTIDQVVGNVTYHVETYVSKASLTGSGSQPFNLTTIVRWTSSVSHGTRELAQRTTTFSSSGCLSTANSPFAAPCQAYYTVRAGDALSGLTVSSSAGPDQLIAGMDASQLRLDFAHTSTNLLIEQTAGGMSSAVTSGASRVGAATTTTGSQSAGAVVDSDPSSVPGQSVTTSTPAQTSGTLTATGTGGTLSLVPSSSDTGAAKAAIAAPAALCTNASGSALTTGISGAERPCASANLQTAGSAATLTYTPPTGSAIPLASFGTGGAPTRAVAALLGTTNAGVCSAGTIVDCGHAATTRSVGTATFGAPGAGSGPGSYTGLWTVTNLSESATAEEGAGALAPTFSRTGTVRVWTGSSYTDIDLAAYSAPATGVIPVSTTWTIPSTSVTYPGGITVTYEDGNLTVQRPTKSQAPATRTGNVATDCKTTACTSTVNGSSGVSAHVTVVVTGPSGELTRFATTVDLGGLTADASYKAAANA